MPLFYKKVTQLWDWVKQKSVKAQLPKKLIVLVQIGGEIVLLLRSDYSIKSFSNIFRSYKDLY